MKKVVFCLIIITLLSSCSVQPNLNDELFFERYNKKYTQLSVDKCIAEENKFFYFLDNGYLIETEHNDNGDIIKISVSGQNNNDINGFVEFVKTILEIYSPEVDYDISIMFDGENGFFDEEIQWYSYLSVIDNNKLFFSVNNKRLNPQKPPELTLKLD